MASVAHLLCFFLFASVCAAETLQEIGTSLPNFEAAECPTFDETSCTLAKCYSETSGYAGLKFKSYVLAAASAGVELTLTKRPANGLVEVSEALSQGDCCWKCATTLGCAYWQWIPQLKTKCHLATSTMEQACEKLKASELLPAVQEEQHQMLIGGRCDPLVETPHLDSQFVGGFGTPFDFNAEPGTTLCLVTNEAFHINGKLAGYRLGASENTAAKESSDLSLPPPKTWVKELGIMWTVEGESHALKLKARSGEEQERGNGFLASAEVDGKSIPRLRVGETFSNPGGLKLTFVVKENVDGEQVDRYNVNFGDILDMDVMLRVAHPLMQTDDDAQAHINIQINDIKYTEDLHGVLGQTFQGGHEERGNAFTKIGRLLDQPIRVDGESGKGFLDGNPEDYISSGTLNTDCKFSTYRSATKSAPVVTVAFI